MASDTARPCDVWDVVESDGTSFKAWSCIRNAIPEVASLLKEARELFHAMSKEHAAGTFGVRVEFHWGTLAGEGGTHDEFAMHVPSATFETCVSRLSQFTDWTCAHRECASYVVDHLPSPLKKDEDTVVTTTSFAKLECGDGNVCAEHGRRLAGSGEDGGGAAEWTVHHWLVNEVRSIVFAVSRPEVSETALPALRVRIMARLSAPAQVLKRMPISIPLNCTLVSERDFWKAKFRYAVMVRFAAKGRSELDEMVRKRLGTHVIEASVEDDGIDAVVANGPAMGAADMLMKATSMLTWPFERALSSLPTVRNVADAGAKRENFSFFRPFVGKAATQTQFADNVSTAGGKGKSRRRGRAKGDAQDKEAEDAHHRPAESEGNGGTGAQERCEAPSSASKRRRKRGS